MKSSREFVSFSGNYGNMSAGYRGPVNHAPPAPMHQNYPNNYSNSGNAGLHPPPPQAHPHPQAFYGQAPSQIYHQAMPNTYQAMGQMTRPMNPAGAPTLDNRAYGPTPPQHPLAMPNRSYV